MMNKNTIHNLKQQLKDASEKIGLTEKLEPLTEKYKSMEADQRRLTKAGVCLTILGLYLFFILSPQWMKLNDLRKKIGQTEGSIEQALRDQSIEPQTIKVKEATRARLEAMSVRILTEDELPDYLNALSKLAKTSNVSIESLKPINPDKINEVEGVNLPANYKFGGYELIGRADYHSMGRFVAGIENEVRFTGIRNFEIFHDAMNPANSHLLKLVMVVMMRVETNATN